MATSVLPFDELNRFADQIRQRYGKEKLKAEDAEDIIDELCEYAEAAGFADYYNRELKGKSEEEIVKMVNQ